MTLLTGRESAARAGISYNAWKLATRTKTGRPRPDNTVTLGGRVVQLWHPATVDAWRATRRPTHVEILADPRRVTPHTARRHRKRHAERACSCYTTSKGLRI